MAGKSDPRVAKIVRERMGSGDRIPVIVTLVPNADPSLLRELDFDIAHVLDAIDAVSGTVLVERIPELEALEDVKYIEYDAHEAHALV